MKTLVVFLLLGVSCMIAHEVIGIIINDTEYYLDLTESEVKHGTVKFIPQIRLDPFTYTNFTLDSPFVGVDEIEYVFGYTPETNWCPENYTNPPQLGASYDYEFGSNSCAGSSVSCDAEEVYMEITYNQCSTFWGVSKPTYTISKQKYSLQDLKK